MDEEHVDEVKTEDFDEKEDFGPSTSSEEVLFPQVTRYGSIKNKEIRNRIYREEKRNKKKAKKQLKAKQRSEGAPKKLPHTLETLREKDITTVEDINAEENEVIRADLEHDEFQNYYKNYYEPKVLITFSDTPGTKSRIFGKELTRIIPNSTKLLRNRTSVKKMVQSAIRENFTDILIINDNRKQPNGLLVIHLPDGPTAHFKLSNVKITKDIKKSHKEITEHRPEVILNRFTTRLGLGVGRMLGALFHYNPEFVGKRVVTFHNQRDYIFFRHYKYDFKPDGTKAYLRELGPRFTLKLKSLQKGTFDSKFGQYEWIIDGRRHDMETSRRKFFL